MDLSKFGEGFWLAMFFLAMYFFLAIAAIWSGNDTAKMIVVGLGSGLSAIVMAWFQMRGQTTTR
jgi:hypothetical protein